MIPISERVSYWQIYTADKMQLNLQSRKHLVCVCVLGGDEGRKRQTDEGPDVRAHTHTQAHTSNTHTGVLDLKLVEKQSATT